MLEKLKELVRQNPNVLSVVRAVYENPYQEKKVFSPSMELSPETIDEILELLTKEMIVLELAGQQDSSIESRIPKKVFLINPDIEYDLETLLE